MSTNCGESCRAVEVSLDPVPQEQSSEDDYRAVQVVRRSGGISVWTCPISDGGWAVLLQADVNSSALFLLLKYVTLQRCWEGRVKCCILAAREHFSSCSTSHKGIVKESSLFLLTCLHFPLSLFSTSWSSRGLCFTTVHLLKSKTCLGTRRWVLRLVVRRSHTCLDNVLPFLLNATWETWWKLIIGPDCQLNDPGDARTTTWMPTPWAQPGLGLWFWRTKISQNSPSSHSHSRESLLAPASSKKEDNGTKSGQKSGLTLESWRLLKEKTHLDPQMGRGRGGRLLIRLLSAPCAESSP